MDLKTLCPLLLGLTIACGSAGADKDKKSDDSADKADKEKKDKKGKGDASAAPGSAQASATPAAKPTETAAAPPTAAAPEPPAGAGNPLATMFTGAPDPAIKFLKQKQIPNKPLWIQVVPYWTANTDEAPEGDPWTDLMLEGKDKHATVHLWVRKPGDAGWDNELSNNCAWAGASGCKFEAPIDGTLGEGLKVKIAQGTAEKNKKPAKLWWMRGELQAGEEFAVYVSLRSDVWPKLEGEQLAMLKSVKIAGPGVK